MPRQVITSIETTAARTPSRSKASAEGNDCIYVATPLVKPDYESQPADNESINAAESIAFFESALTALPPSAAKSYGKATASLRSFISAFRLQYSPLTTAVIADWLITLRLDGIALSTLTLYLNAISSLYNRIGNTLAATCGDTASPTASPRNASLPAIDFTTLRARLAETIDTREVAARRIPLKDTGKVADTIPADLLSDLYTTAVIAGGIPLEAAARLRTSDLSRYPSQISEIATRWSDPHRKYIFPLHQTAYTPRRLARRLAEAMATSSDSRLRTLPSPSYTWLRTAMQCGATPGEAIAILGRDPLLHHPHGDITRLLSREERRPLSREERDLLSREERHPISREEERPRPSQIAIPEEAIATQPHHLFQLIAEALTDDPLHWYALRYRQGVTHEEIAERLARIAADPEAPVRPDATFYPCEETATRKEHGPIRHILQPVLPGILFIRTRLTRLQPLLRRIADLAWCYRDPSRRDRSFAPIPDNEMHAFQLSIGVFTPETTVAPPGAVPPRPGQPVEILGGPFAGRPALFLAEVPAPATAEATPTTLYRLLLTGDNGIDWEATLDSRLIRPL